MKIYTSYFGNARKLAAAGVKIINVALYPPRYSSYPTLRGVAPTRALLHENDPERYTEGYKELVLARLDPQGILDDIEGLGDGRDVALCCYERPGELCHRHLLADFLNAAGADIREWAAEYDNPTLDF